MGQDGDRSIQVLHVEDEPDVADLTATYLERESDRIEVVTANDAQAGLERLGEMPVDCVVSDYQMPGMDGIEFLEAVQEKYPNLPFILYTGKGSEEVASEAIANGASDYLQKRADPSQYELLANRIERAVDSRRTERRAVDLETVRDLIGDVNQALVRADDREAIETRVCEVIAGSDRYDAALVARVDPTEQRVTPTSSCGFDGTPTAIEGAFPDPVATAIDSGDVRVIEELAAHEDAVAEVLAEREGFNSVAIAPLAYNGDRHGLLAVHAAEPDAFDARDRDLLAELAGDIAHAIDAVETREALRHERDRRAALFENAPSSMAEVVFEDDAVVIRDVNAAFEDTFGVDRETIAGRHVTDIIIGEGHRESYESIVERARAGEHVREEVTRETAEGNREFLLTVAPFDIEDVHGAYVWHVDITERKELEAELQDKANLLDQLFEQLPVSLYVKDREGRHLYMSDYDVSPEAVMGKTDLEIYDDEEFARSTYEDDMQVIETGEAILNKEEYNEDNGEWTLTSKVPWYGEDGDIKGLIGVTRFITEKKEYEREIERKNERLEKFASVISHDLRNPLNVAIGHADLLAQDYDDNRIDRVETALERMEALIEDILELARHGEGAFEPAELTLSVIANQAWENVQTGDVELEIDEDFRFCGAKARVLELFENLLTNAYEHGDPSTVRVGPLPDADGFYVADDGPGIPEDERDDVFRPGFTTDEEGTGFGLSIVEEIVESHGWNIAVTESKDGGARFEISDVERC